VGEGRRAKRGEKRTREVARGGRDGEERRGRAEGSRVEATEGVGRAGRRMRRVIK